MSIYALTRATRATAATAALLAAGLTLASGVAPASADTVPAPAVPVTVVAWNSLDGVPGWVVTYPVPAGLAGSSAAVGTTATDPAGTTASVGGTLDQDPADWALGEVFVSAADHLVVGTGSSETAVANDAGTQLCITIRVADTDEDEAVFGGTPVNGWLAAYAGCATLDAPAAAFSPSITARAAAISTVGRVRAKVGAKLRVGTPKAFPVPDTTTISWIVGSKSVPRAHGNTLMLTRAMRGKVVYAKISVTHRNYTTRVIRSAKVLVR